MDLLITYSSLAYSRCIKDELFVRNTRTNSNYMLHYLLNISSYIIIECKMHYVSLRKTYKI